MELEKYGHDTTIPIIALDQDDRCSMQELLSIYAEALQLLSPSEDEYLLLTTIHQLQAKLDLLATMQEDEALDIDTLGNHALQMAFDFHLSLIPLLHLDAEQEQDLIKEVKSLQARMKAEHIISSTGGTSTLRP